MQITLTLVIGGYSDSISDDYLLPKMHDFSFLLPSSPTRVSMLQWRLQLYGRHEGL